MLSFITAIEGVAFDSMYFIKLGYVNTLKYTIFLFLNIANKSNTIY